MILHELTRDQQDFATEHHNLVYAFLKDKKLCYDDYYDVIVFGYLRAVRQYCSREDLRERFSFSTIAWRKMTDDLYKHYKKQSRPLRNAVTISLDTLIYDGDWTPMHEIIPNTNQHMRQLEEQLLWDEIASLLTETQAETLRMLTDGYSIREIASARHSQQREIVEMLYTAQETVRALCLA